MGQKNDTVNHLRCLKPKDQHKTYRFQERVAGRWVTLQRPEIDSLNALVRTEVISHADALARAEVILKGLYRERDQNKPVPTLLPGNEKILQDFLKKKYPPRKLRDMAPDSYKNEVYYLQKALLALDNLPIDGKLDPIQDRIDKKFEKKHKIHRRRTTSINRLRLFLSLDPILHMKAPPEDIVYLHIDKIKELIDKLEDPYKTMAAVAFYTGVRRGELFAITSQTFKGDVIYVNRQMRLDGSFDLPKHGKRHKAFVIPGGHEWVERWIGMKDGDATKTPPTHPVSRHTKVSREVQKHAGVRFHDLRHSTAVHLIGQGATLDWVAQSLGHTRETCERFYSGFVLEDDAIRLMRLLFDTRKTS